MAKLALVYGLHLLPGDELDSVGEGSIVLKNGRARIRAGNASPPCGSQLR